MKRNISSHSHASRKNERGFAFVTVAILTFLVYALSLSYFDVLVSERRQAISVETGMKAEAIAEAAVEEVLWEYNFGGGDFSAGDGWSGALTKTKDVTAFTDASGNTIGSYSTSVSNWSTTTPTITATGTVSETGAGAALTATTITKLKARPLFNAGVKVNGAMTMSGNAVVDSYLSTTGPYGGANIRQNGDVLTNYGAVPSITLTGNSLVKGDAATGTGGTVSNPSKVTGSISNSANETISSASVPALLTLLPSLGSLNNSTPLVAGSYKYTDVDLSGNDIVTVTGPVSLYLTSTSTAFSMSGNSQIQLGVGGTLTVYSEGDYAVSGNGAINYGGSQNVQSILLYGTATCDSFAMSGNGILNGVVNAPQAAISLTGNGTLYGSAIGSQFTASGNGALHFDENLPNGGPNDGLKVDWHRHA